MYPEKLNKFKKLFCDKIGAVDADISLGNPEYDTARQTIFIKSITFRNGITISFESYYSVELVYDNWGDFISEGLLYTDFYFRK